MSSSKSLVSVRPIDPIELTIFSDLLSRVSRFHSLARFAYGGMSGFALDDLKKLSRELGLKRLLAFDEELEVFKRQQFNKPTASCRVRLETLNEFASTWQDIFLEEGIEDAESYILWVRRDPSEEIGQGVRYFQQLVSALPDYGIARVTLLVDFDKWAGPMFTGDGTRRTLAEREKDVSAKLKEHVSEFIKVGSVAERTDLDHLCKSLAAAYGNGAGMAIGSTSGRTFEPLSVVRYGVGLVEVTITGMVVPVSETAALRGQINEGEWPFASASWEEVRHVRLPDVTLRERLEIEAAEGDSVRALNRLGFDLDAATGEKGLFDSFSKHHRYLPTLVAAEI